MSTFFALLGSLLLVVLFAVVAKRLLGAYNMPPLRTFGAALVGYGLGFLVFLFMTRVEDVDNGTANLTALILSLVFTMMAIVTFEVLSDYRLRRRSRSPNLGVPNPAQWTRDQIDSARRTAEITSIAARHGFGKGVDPSQAEGGSDVGRRLAAALDEAGGIYVKLGQILSTRSDVLGPEIAGELATLQQDSAPASREEIEPHLIESLGADLDTVFIEFDWEPIGSASLAQVYRARLVDGTDVVVKVQRPNIDQEVERDLRIIAQVSGYLDVRTEWGEMFNLAELADEFADTVRKELDYEREATTTAEVQQAFSAYPALRVPAVYTEISSPKVLVQEFIEGPTLGRAGVVGGEQGRMLADQLFDAQVAAMINGDRFHADPHPGNLILCEDDQLGLIDFGLSTRLDAFERAGLNDVLSAIALYDPSLLSEAAFTIGEPRREVDGAKLERACARIMTEHLDPSGQPTAEMLNDFLDIVYRFGLALPPNITALFRALVTLQGSLEQLSPNYPLIERAQKLASEQMQTTITPDTLALEAKNEVIRLAPLLRRAPVHMDRIAGQLERGKLGVRVSLLSGEQDVRVISTLVNRFVLAFIGIGLGVVSVMLFSVETDVFVVRHIDMFDILGFIGLFTGATLIMRVALDVFREQ